MNKEEKELFINNFINSIKEDLLSKLDSIPENWDGFELRHYINIKFEQENLWKRKILSNTDKIRKQRCLNDIYNNGL
jgi:hypothetical protein